MQAQYFLAQVLQLDTASQPHQIPEHERPITRSQVVGLRNHHRLESSLVAPMQSTHLLLHLINAWDHLEETLGVNHKHIRPDYLRICLRREREKPRIQTDQPLYSLHFCVHFCALPELSHGLDSSGSSEGMPCEEYLPDRDLQEGLLDNAIDVMVDLNELICSNVEILIAVLVKVSLNEAQIMTRSHPEVQHDVVVVVLD